MTAMHEPPHPGEVLQDYLPPKSVMTKSAFAEHVHMTRQWLDKLLKGQRDLTIDDAVSLGLALDVSPEALLNLQTQWALWQASQKPLPDIKPIPHAA